MTIGPAAAVVSSVDCHAHVMQRDYPLAPERHSAPARDVTLEEYLAVLDAHEVSHGVLTAPSFYGADNTILLRALARAPTRLRGTAIVEPETDVSALAALREQGVRGIRLNWVKRKSLPDVATPAWRKLFAAVRELDLHVEIYLEGELLPGVLPVIRDCGATVVLDHFGCPDPAAGVASKGLKLILQALTEGNTWVKLSAPYRLGGADPQRYVDAFLAAGGLSRLVWASDWPFVGHESSITYRQCQNWLKEWLPGEDTRKAVLVDNPRRLFGF